MTEILFAPFTDYAFMRHALIACIVLALGGAPLGAFMVLRRMSLAGDAMAHAILPGVALAFLFFGFSMTAMLVGGLTVGTLVSLLAAFLTRRSGMKEDSSLALIYLMSLAAGVVLVSMKGSAIDLLHLLFGDILAIDTATLHIIATTSTLTLFGLFAFYRSFVIASVDPDFARAATRGHDASALLFPILLALNLVSAFQAMGTLMALGLIILPALTARFFAPTIDRLIGLSLVIAGLGSYLGLLLSYYATIPAGPAIVLTLGTFTLLSALFKTTQK